MTMSAGVSMLVGRKMALSQSNVMQNVLDQSDFISLKQTLKDIFFWTFAIELTGSIILSARFYVLLKVSVFRSLFLGFFHSISAFCNAGFSVFSDSFVSLSVDPVVNLTIIGLIISGGIGFTVISALNGFFTGYSQRKLSCHVHMVVLTTIFLIILGTIVIFALEFKSPEMSNFSFNQKILVSLFQSVTTRTAGFNTVDFAKLGTSTLFFMCLLMFIGASPGSTGGGVKTTTLATILLFLDATMRGKSQVTYRGRTITYDTVLKAFLVTAISAGLVFIYSFLLILLEDKPVINLLFEAFSAFATVGLSTGITGSLCSASKILIITLMFIGRIGPLTMALSIRTQSNTGKFSYPETKLLVG